MGKELREIEDHVGAGIRLAEQLAVEMDGQRTMHPALVPVSAEFIRRDSFWNFAAPLPLLQERPIPPDADVNRFLVFRRAD